ncbi:Uncharacterized protein APZ42_021876 [Daphnia magna]|uniref:Uncharacterized protein n=1 Tax=Daphnia magna TaxID=35525 RepID=A0A164WBL4_9CRUS|nr:Uncharacterized protein APZ42_021876 [Daphnia magna]
MDNATKIKLLSIIALITILLVTYLAALHIDSLAKARYVFKRNSRSVVGKDLSYNSNLVSRYKQKVRTEVIDAKVNQKYSLTINSTYEYIFQYSYKQNLLENQALSVQIFSQLASREDPILVVVRQQKAVLSWQLPLLLETSNGWQEYSSVSRQLCTEPLDRNVSVEHEFFLDVSTSDPENLSFVASVSPIADFVVGLNENHTVALTASEPKYYRFRFPEDIENVLLTVMSDDNYCMSVSVQNLSCPVFDMDRDLKYGGIWQTVMSKTGMTISVMTGQVSSNSKPKSYINLDIAVKIHDLDLKLNEVEEYHVRFYLGLIVLRVIEIHIGYHKTNLIPYNSKPP